MMNQPPTLVSVQPIHRDGERPALRLVVNLGDGPSTTLATLTPYQAWPCWSWDPSTGRYWMGVEPHEGNIAIPTDEVHAVLGTDWTPTPPRAEVESLKRDGKRTLRLGQAVYCQPKQRKGTGRVAGVVRTVYADGGIIVATGAAVVEVGAEWVQATNRK